MAPGTNSRPWFMNSWGTEVWRNGCTILIRKEVLQEG
ncbi:hypothetical protein LINGRAHAP2_LOCUS10026 [Linum grandiflorum]